ncbi:Non-histone chromosomal protein 6 [Gaertneriomyces semiglobifer]|nr:Non-histone chromosomal protein 6 [Gaertneriomyces semiglobifer]
MPKAAASKPSTKTRGKGTRAKKDPNAPKKPLSAFMLFSQAMRPKVKEENPDVTFGDTGKILGERWREMDDAEKAKWQKKSEEAKKTYEKVLKDYNVRKWQSIEERVGTRG